jgi:hypothetical protein
MRNRIKKLASIITNLPTEWRVRALNTVANLLQLKVMLQSSYRLLPVDMFLVIYIDLKYVGFEVAMAVTVKIGVCGDVILCSWYNIPVFQGNLLPPCLGPKSNPGVEKMVCV